MPLRIPEPAEWFKVFFQRSLHHNEKRKSIGKLKASWIVYSFLPEGPQLLVLESTSLFLPRGPNSWRAQACPAGENFQRSSNWIDSRPNHLFSSSNISNKFIENMRSSVIISSTGYRCSWRRCNLRLIHNEVKSVLSINESYLMEKGKHFHKLLRSPSPYSHEPTWP